jgi:hypothetical protein
VKHPFGAKQVHAVLVNDRAAPGPVAGSVGIAIIGPVFESPKRLSRFAFQAREAGFVSGAIELEEPALADGTGAEAFSELVLPKDFRTLGRPREGDADFGRFSIPAGTQEVGPICPGFAGPQVLGRGGALTRHFDPEPQSRGGQESDQKEP